VRRITCFRSNRLLFGAVLGCAFSAQTSAWAQAIAAPTPLERAAGEVSPAAAAQRYDGVVPGPTGKNPLPSAPLGGTYLVWTGFQMTDGGSQVFLQTTGPVVVEKGKSSKSVLAVLLRGCRIHMANNRRKIDTRYFATPVASVSAKQKGRDVEVRIALRESVTVEPRDQAGPEGTKFVVLDFPPGKAASEPSALQGLTAGTAAPDQARTPEDSDSATTATDRSGRAGMKAAAKSSE
jgi:hypothetical protein